MSVSISGSAVTFNDASTQNTAATGFGFKNRIINGAMMIDQRNAGAASANTINGYFLDRWYVTQSVTGKIIAQQNAGSVTPPAGFTNYLGVTSQSAYTVGAGDIYRIWQIIEGFNCADFGWGTANAQNATISFWVRSSLTGTFGGCIGNQAGTRSYPFSYTISAANTWEQKTITVAGDTSGTYATNNTGSITLQFGIGVGTTYSGTAGSWSSTAYVSATGATSVVGTNGATFYITGVQLEKGSTATSFDYRPYGTELALAQRYYQRFSTLSGAYSPYGTGMEATTTIASIMIKYTVSMRSSPTIGFSTIGVYDGAATRAVSSIGSTYSNTEAIYGDFTHASGGTAARPVILLANASTSGYLDLSAEL